ncbi:hypothetical protein D4764_19G0007670 [Takifugu flavidus]|uniref:Uncharacterized protein n=1 Tax=Takifugu flavidus TaxID=433684 RepID=A0A5C6NQQ2_9TELE|nr:hypothetical protein D4764_19G0007670 [Takifugu flavidus]
MSTNPCSLAPAGLGQEKKGSRDGSRLDCAKPCPAFTQQMKAEEEEVNDMARALLLLRHVDPPCLDLGIIQELGNFLDRQDEAQLQKRKRQHQNWTYNAVPKPMSHE